jgi:hypothetical protein
MSSGAKGNMVGPGTGRYGSRRSFIQRQRSPVMATYRAAEVSDAPAISQLARRALQPHVLPGWTGPAIERLLNENSEIAVRDFLPETAFAHVSLESGSVVGFITSKLPRLVSLLVVDPLHQ